MIIPNPEFDKPGYCAKCHEPIAEFDGANKIVRLLGRLRVAQFRLDDNSLMNVTICEDCQAKINPIDTVEIMDSVKKGWVFERDTLAKNNEPLKDEHSETYQYKYIVERRDVPWNRETIIEAVYAEEIAAGEELARERGISL